MAGGSGAQERDPGKVAGIRGASRRVQVDDDDVDRLHAALGQGRYLVALIAPDADRAEEIGVSEIGERVDDHLALGQVGPGFLGRGALDFRLLERANQLDDPFAVRNGEQGSQAGDLVSFLAAERAAAAPASVPRV